MKKSSRELAMQWWHTLSPSYKEDLFIQYASSHFTPATNHTLLTGREIEIIYSQV